MSSRSKKLVALGKAQFQAKEEELRIIEDDNFDDSSSSGTTNGHNGYLEYEINQNDAEEQENGKQQGSMLSAEIEEPIENNSNQAVIPSEKRRRSRSLNMESWKAQIRKRNRNKGIEYTTTSGEIHLPRFPKNINIPCNCTLKCHDKVDDDKKSEIFRLFWDLGSIEKQRNFVIANVKRFLSVRKRVSDNSRRQFSQKYFLPYKNEKHQVCKSFFLKTLDISEKMVRTSLSKRDRNSISLASPDQRGHHVPGVKIPDNIKKHVQDHIDSFPRVPAHWCRKDSKKEYLEPILNKSRMYSLYKADCEEKKIRHVSETLYRKFLTEKNIGFHVPRKDQCWCHGYEQMPEEERELQKERYELHLKRKNWANMEKKKDAEIAKNDPSFCSANFDLEAVLYCPLFHAKPIFYKRKLANFNFTVYDVGSKQGFCFIWPEYEGKRGSNEVATCLRKFIDGIPNHIKKLSLFSDCCAGQNKNSIVACMLQQAVKESSIEIIDMKFLEPGHTHMECDSMHATIETAPEYAKILLPTDWHNVIRLAKKDSRPFTVNILSHIDFIDYKEFKERLYNYSSKTIDGQTLNWKEVRWLQFRKSDSDKVFFKNEFWDNDFQCIDVSKRRVGRSDRSTDLNYAKAYKSVIPLEKKKYLDLVSLCNNETCLIPRMYHDFYKSLPHDLQHNSDDEDDLSLAALRARQLKRKRRRN